MDCMQGKVGFITGGDSGIGLGIAQAFLRAGMKVALTYRTTKHLNDAMTILNSARKHVHAIRMDVSDRGETQSAAQEAVEVFGKVHVLVNNAGVAPLIPLSNATFDDWDWCMNVNVNGAFNCIRALLPHIKSHGEGGHIVSTASMVGGLIAGPYWGLYSTSKFAVVGLMEALRSELRNSGIGVSVFCPADVRSNIARSERNRPAQFAIGGKPDSDQQAIIDAYRRRMVEAIIANGGEQTLMDPLEAGERVVDGILRDDLYILSHAEYEIALQDRSDALLASVSRAGKAPSATRVAMASVARNAIYLEEIEKLGREHQPTK